MVNFEISSADEGAVAPEGEDSAPAFAADATPLISLKARREQILNELYIDIQVPRWEDPEIFVRFKPVSATKFAAAMEKRRKQKSDDWTLLANADMLVDSCMGVYCILPGTLTPLSLRPGNPSGDWTKFDPELGEALGINAERAVDVCLGLYLTEGDLIDTANKLFRWSGLANEEADEAF